MPVAFTTLPCHETTPVEGSNLPGRLQLEAFGQPATYRLDRLQSGFHEGWSGMMNYNLASLQPDPCFAGLDVRGRNSRRIVSE